MRLCGAQTIPGLAIPSNVKINNVVPAVQGDKDTDNMLGPLINILQHNVLIGGIPAIASIADMSGTDVRGIIPHIQGLPIPISGSQNVMIGQGSGMAGIGMMGRLLGGGFGGLQIGELVGIGSQIIGTVQNFTGLGGGSAVAQISGLQGNPLSPGSTVTGQTTGHTFTFSNIVDSRITTGQIRLPDVNTVTNALVQDDGEYIVIDDYFNLYPTQNLTLSVVTV
jgi:hypothetical protein